MGQTDVYARIMARKITVKETYEVAVVGLACSQ